MPKVTFTWSDGRIETINADIGNSLMFAAITNGIDGIEAECGGGLVCGTCHVHVDASWINEVGKSSAIEDELLDGVPGVCSISRLSCQIKVTPELEGLIVSIPSIR